MSKKEKEKEKQKQNINTKYNNQVYIELPKNANERKVAIAEWSEGNKDLEKVLTVLSDLNLTSFFCCGGHENKKAAPYITYVLDDYSLVLFKNMVSHLNHLVIISTLYNKSLNKHLITFSTTYEFKNTFFNEIFVFLKTLKDKGNSNLESFKLKDNSCKCESRSFILKCLSVFLDFQNLLRQNNVFPDIILSLLPFKDKSSYLQISIYDEFNYTKFCDNFKNLGFNLKSLNDDKDIFYAIFLKEIKRIEELEELYKLLKKEYLSFK